MSKFGYLTSYIPRIKALGNSVDSEKADRLIIEFNRDVHRFVDDNGDLELQQYSKILERLGIEYSSEGVNSADYKTVDGQGVSALIVTVVRADRIYEGTLQQYFRNGYLLKWLERLQEIDKP